MRKFDLNKGIAILERTPVILEAFLKDLSEEWTLSNEGGDSWSPFDVVGHLIHGEKTDWIQRMKIILGEGPGKTFAPFDRFAQFESSKGKSMNELLDEFKERRAENLAILKMMKLSEDKFILKAIHPGLGEVSMKQLLSAWVAHDLGHIAQISRVMAKQYKEEVGPWNEYLTVMHR